MPSLIELPPELRNHIYKLMLFEVTQHSLLQVRGSLSKRDCRLKWRFPSVLQVSTQFRSDSSGIYYHETSDNVSLNIRVELKKREWCEDMVNVTEWLDSIMRDAKLTQKHPFKDVRLHIYKPEWRYLYSFLPQIQFLHNSGLKVGTITHTELALPNVQTIID